MSIADAYRAVLNGARIEETGLDLKSIKKLKLFMLYVDRDMLQTEVTKKTGLSRSSIYQLKKVRGEYSQNQS
jgi:DNA-binding XRE family transcriptional regulator